MKELEQNVCLQEKRGNPYVISSDVSGLMQRWTKQNGLQLPKNGFFNHLEADLHDTLNKYFPDVEIINEQEIRAGLHARVARTAGEVVSLDRAYITSQTPNVIGFLDFTRAIDEDFNDIGLRERPGKPPIDEQLRQIKTTEIQSITIVDDVIFSGEGAIKIAKDLTLVNRRVDKIIAGIGIAEGVELIEAQGIEVETVKRFDDVIDEVCARDFYPGVPMSGRSVYTADGKNYSAPYIEPFGIPERWASIPAEHAEDFSKKCISHAAIIWEEVERASDVKIPTKRVPRQIRGVEDNQSVVFALRKMLR